MPIDPTTPAASSAQAESTLRRLLGGMSVFTLLMTIPQVLTIWLGHEAAGVSVASWSAYLLSAVLLRGPVVLVRHTEARQEYLSALRRMDRPR